MNTYVFAAFDADGIRIGETQLNDDSLPGHLNTCMSVLCRNSKAKTYRMVTEKGSLLDPLPVNPERYLSHEFRNILTQCDNAWFGAVVKLQTGQKVKLTGFGDSIFDKSYHFTAYHNSEYLLLKSKDLVNAKVIEKGYDYKY